MTFVNLLAIGLALSAMAFGVGRAHAQPLTKLSIVVFSPPSLGAFMPPVIKARKLDAANGLDISVQWSTPLVDFANWGVGQTSQRQTVWIHNSGNTPVVVIRLILLSL